MGVKICSAALLPVMELRFEVASAIVESSSVVEWIKSEASEASESSEATLSAAHS